MGRGSRLHARLNRREWERARFAAFERDAWRCRDCGASGGLKRITSNRWKGAGRPYAVENLRTLRRACHVAEHRQIGPERAAWQEFLRDSAR